MVQHLTAFYDVGEHNHIRLRGADWNDALDMAKERGESVAFTGMYGDNLEHLAGLVLELSKKTGVQTVFLAEELRELLEDREELYENAEEGGRKTLLRNEMKELADMVMSGETLERQHYFAVWGNVNKIGEKDIVDRAKEIAKMFEDNAVQTIHAEVVDRKGIVRLCNLINIPAYVHIESTDIDETMSVLSGN